MPNTIKVKRGKSAALNTSTEKLQAGEVLYNLDKNYLTVGAEDNDALTKKPIAAREIVGYTGDTDSKIGASTTEAYSIKYDTQLKIKDGNNTLLVPKKDGTLATTEDIATELGNYYTKTESDAKYSQATNLENGTGLDSLVQKYSGEVDDTHYASSTTGESDVCLGEANKSSGKRNVIGGKLNQNTGSNNLIGGLRNNISSNHNVVGGQNNTNSQGTSNLIAGQQNKVNSPNNIVAGKENTVTINGQANIVSGEQNLLGRVTNSIICGDNDNIELQQLIGGIKAGLDILNNSDIQGKALLGQYNKPKTNTLLEIGNGTGPSAGLRKNAFEVLKDGRAKVQTAPTENDDVVRKLELDKSWNKFNLKNGSGQDSLVQKYVKNDVDHSSIATGVGSVAFGGLRFDYDPEKHSGDKTNTAAGNQSFVAGCGNYTAGDWSFVTGKDNTVYSNRAFVSGGANVSQAINSEGNLLEEKTNVGRFNAIFGNNNTFKSSDTSKESNLIAGGSNTVDTERSIVVGYNNNVAGHYDAIFGFTNAVNADYSLTGGRNHVVNGGFHLVAGSDNEVSGQFNIASGQDNNNAGWSSAVIGRGLIVGETHTSQTVLGQYNDNKPDTVLEIGWGDVNNRKNIFEVYRDGIVKTEKGVLSTEEYARNYTDNAVAPLKKLKKLNIGDSNTDADADNSLTVGLHALNRGHQSAAIGYDAYVGYDSSGKPVSNAPTGAIALGWSRANADYSLSAGHDTEVNHQWSAALNNNTKTGANSQTVIGSYNAAKTTTAFEVGNGTLDHRSNAFEVLQDGRAKVQTAPTESDDVVRKKEIDTKLNLSEFSVLTQSQVDSLF